MRTLYRLVYKNGDHGAWDDDIGRIYKYANFFHAEIEVKNDGYFGTVPSEVITDWCKAPEQEKNMYKVWLDFVNDDGYIVTAFLDNNGQGFSFKVAKIWHITGSKRT